ncbi:pyrroline-5-carboxylate reductase [Zavarzinella formosa]|uniref:pyrroline-5-carboxylate reductase n=1 Tax=Zavarzinella formosa TaxID=360055 RepID=UPI000301BA29|nr:pyrroline-5-carboxylate reductase [Zavarzinella formosa]
MSDTISTPLKIGFLGAGQMATALAKGWLDAGLVTAATLRASDPVPEARTRFQQQTGGAVTTDNLDVLKNSEVLILAVKPQVMTPLLAEISGSVREDHVIISIAAGLTLKKLADGLLANFRLIRVMPNTPCLLGASAAGFSVGPGAKPEDAALVERLFNAVGKAFAVPEYQLDAVTGLSGSGPAFVYVMIEALADGGVRMGLPRDVAQTLAAQTVMGAARMVLETKQHPGVLKDAVTSPGGTTIAGLHALERGGLRAAVMDAVEAATKRATELGGK